MSKRLPLIIFALAVTTASVVLVARPVRSNLGADGVEGVSEDWSPTAADYIQDGLVCMFDGIENAGWGVHDENATKPYDLISGQTDMGIASTFVANDDNLEVSVESASTVNQSLLGAAMADAIADGFGYIEAIVFVNSPETAIYGNYININNCSFGWQYKTGRGGINAFRSGWLAVADATTANAGAVRLSYTIDVENSSVVYTVGGVSSAPKAITIPDSILQSSYIRGAGTKIFSLRCYSRALTPAEKDNNYTIDKIRFGL